MKKDFDCVEMKRQIQEKIWLEAGETFQGLLDLLNENRKNNPLLKELLERKEKENQLETV
ncbi:MAG TPA: hypothetical protein PKY56_11365 [Candidatus Kapabacteria bacterium]|nr:hypothetical protein [Candidatus Kapabacteria bacterium]HPO63403.1 hypothetical protein [Candidatus Kapabacteria bacterium]